VSIPRIDPSVTIGDLQAAADRFRDAGLEYWEMLHKCEATARNTAGAVVWLTDADGSMVIFTRGEYRERLMMNIDRIPGNKAFSFGVAGEE